MIGLEENLFGLFSTGSQYLGDSQTSTRIFVYENPVYKKPKSDGLNLLRNF